MDEERKYWSESNQFQSNFAATALTKYQYGFEVGDSLYLTETESYLKALSLLKQVPLYGDNTKMHFVAAPDRYKYGKILQKNIMQSDLYLRHFNYLDFYYGYFGYMDHKLSGINKDYTEFFTSIDFDAPDTAATGWTSGYEAYMRAYNYTINKK